MSLGTLVANDVRLQLRHGFYGAYLVLTASYVLLLRRLPDEAEAVAAALVVFSDPSVFGFFCVGALLMLERDEGVHAALFTTRASPGAYVLAKAGSLSLLALLTSSAIPVMAGVPFAAAPLAAGVALTATLFILLGIAAGCRFRTFNRFALGGGVGLLALAAPLLPYFRLLDAPPLALLPSYASLVLIGGAFGLTPGVPQSSLFATSWLLAWCAAAALVARAAVVRRLARGSGP